MKQSIRTPRISGLSSERRSLLDEVGNRNHGRSWAEFVFLGLAVFCWSAATGQIQVDQTLTPEEYVNTVLLGEGVEAFNVTYTGGLSQLGYLTQGEDSFSIASGLVLSSDASENLECSINTCDDCLGGAFADPDLLDIANSVPPMIGQNFTVTSVNDGCVLEFDFVSGGDSISFNYVFGSDEYETWINTQYNDVFAFFLSGPGITGPFDSPAGFPDGAVNIAGVPDTDPILPITISSVNSGTNAVYYEDNQGGTDVCINGYTVPFTAEYAVQCGATYHIKLAIADGSDTALESIVVLEEGSFSSNAFDLVASASVSGNQIFLGDTTVVEYCNDAIFQIIRPSATTEDTLNVTISGTATNGVDYDTIDPEVIMLVGQYIYDLPLVVVGDEDPEGSETVTIEYLYTNLCGDSVLRSATLVIEDFEQTTLDFESPVLICQGEAVLEVNPISGYGPYTYSWTTGPNDTLAVNIISTDVAGQATVTVTDVCGRPVEGTLMYAEPPEWFASITQLLDDPVICPGDSVYLQANTIPEELGPLEYVWSTGGDVQTELVNLDTTTTVVLTVTDACEIENVVEWEVEIPVYDPITGDEDDVCIGLQASLGLDGGSGSYTFFTWQYSNFDSNQNPQDSVWVPVDQTLDTLVTFFGPFGNYQSTTQPGAMQVWAIDQCGSDASFMISLVACDTEIPNVFSPNNDTHNDFFRIPGIEGFPNSSVEIFNRWGNLIFQDDDYKGGWDGRMNGDPVSDGTYYYVLRRSDGETFYGPLTILRKRQ
ncbi:MAG: choice-of-anchor L domain-containing protein [Bacteroidetes bacterium]|nr:choice-of-anchor L domain-containing protein [Bacteroidota bacterium]